MTIAATHPFSDACYVVTYYHSVYCISIKPQLPHKAEYSLAYNFVIKRIFSIFVKILQL